MTSNSRFRIIVGIVVAIVIIVALVILNRPASSSSIQSTDDAYIQADVTIVAPQVSGVITKVNVSDNQSVVAGASLADIDDRDLHIAVDRAKAQVDSAQASIESLHAQLERQQSMIAQAKSTVVADEANIKLADENRRRFTNLAKDGSGTVQAKQQAEAQWEIQRATHERDMASLRSSQQQIAILQADQNKAKAALETAQAQQAAAELNLSYANVVAPISGVVTQRSVRIGGYAHTGEPLLAIVPMNALYVEANYLETQLANVKVGQPVTLNVDALPGVKLKGHVESLGPASGVSFSPIQAHNATGNFTKIVQRLPVRIALDSDQSALKDLRVGMSVEPNINTSAN